MRAKIGPKPLSSHQWRGMTIGLLGGSFNPPHQGHVLLSLTAIKALSLDCVWWLVTPQNPLKPKTDLQPLQKRLEASQHLTRKYPRLIPSDIEKHMHCLYTIDTVRELKKKFPHTRFVWICGSDIAAQFSRWKRWRQLLKEIPFVCLARPPHPSIVRGTALRILMRNHMRTDEKGGLSYKNPPDWLWLLNTRTSEQSSSKLRKNKDLAKKVSLRRTAGLNKKPKKR